MVEIEDRKLIISNGSIVSVIGIRIANRTAN